MPRDTASSPAPSLPCWLQPRLLCLLADGIAAEVARGASHPLAVRVAHERCRAINPAWPAPFVVEAVALAEWIAQALGPDA